MFNTGTPPIFREHHKVCLLQFGIRLQHIWCPYEHPPFPFLYVQLWKLSSSRDSGKNTLLDCRVHVVGCFLLTLFHSYPFLNGTFRRPIRFLTACASHRSQYQSLSFVSQSYLGLRSSAKSRFVSLAGISISSKWQVFLASFMLNIYQHSTQCFGRGPLLP